MNIDEQGDEHIIDENFHGAFDENLFQDLVVNDILDPDLNIDIPNMEGARQGAGQQEPQRMVIVDPMVRKLNQQTIILMHLMIIWKYNRLMLQMLMWHKSQPGLVIHCLVKPKSGLTKVEMVDHMLMLQIGML